MTTVALAAKRATGISHREGEAPVDYARRLAKAIGALSDDEWEELPEEVQRWANEAVRAITQRSPQIPLPEGTEALLREVSTTPPVGPRPSRVARTTRTAPEAVVVKTSNKAGGGRKGKFPEGARILVVAERNPFREGSKCHGWFSKIENGMTIAEAVSAGAPRNHIRWAHSLGHLRIS